MNPAKISVKFEYKDEIHRVIKMPSTYQDLLETFKKYYPQRQGNNYIIYYQINDENYIISDEFSFKNSISTISEKNVKSIKFQFITHKDLIQKKNSLPSEKSISKITQIRPLLSEVLISEKKDAKLERKYNSYRYSNNSQRETMTSESFESLEHEFHQKKKYINSLSPEINDQFPVQNRKNSLQNEINFSKTPKSTLIKYSQIQKTKPIYKAKLLTNEELLVVKLKTNEKYELNLEFLNSGFNKWPSSVSLHCVCGKYEGKIYEVGAVDSDERIKINIPLMTPKKIGNFKNAWRLAYKLNEHDFKYFGPRIIQEMNVIFQNFSDI